MTESLITPTTFPFRLLARFNPANPEVTCHPAQWQEIISHHQRVLRVFDVLSNHPQAHEFFNFLPEDNHLLEEIRLAISLHDCGKALIDNHIHTASKSDTLDMKAYDQYYQDHSAKIIKFLGPEFTATHPLAAALILNHHPDSVQGLQLDVDPGILNSIEYQWGLAVVIAVDGITAGHEIRYRRTGPESAATTINILNQKLAKHQLDKFINIKAMVITGYQILSQLGF